MLCQGAQTAQVLRCKLDHVGRVLLAVAGFALGAVIAAGTTTLGTELAQVRTFRNVVPRPIIRVLAAIYVAACGTAAAPDLKCAQKSPARRGPAGLLIPSPNDH